MTAGRPRIFPTFESMEVMVKEYFEEDKHPTMAGLCSYLKIPKQTLHEYEKREEYSDLIKGARLQVEAEVERQLLYGKGGAAGPIFWLKNHSDYVDATQQDVNVKGDFVVSDTPTVDEFDEEFAVGTPTGSADSTD